MSHPSDTRAQGPPRLSLSTGGAGPSTPNPTRRPQGARTSRRGGPGLFVANPDNSDSDISPKASPVWASPATTSSQSSVRGVPISAVSGNSGGSGGYGNVSPTASTGYGSLTGRGVPHSYRMSPSNSAPTVPAPNTPLPHSASYQATMQPPASVPLEPAPVVPNAPHVQSYPSYPLPQPKRHYTTPTAASTPEQRAHETRHGSVGGTTRPHPPHPPSHHSPGRHLPPLPSPSLQSAPILPHQYSEPTRPPLPHAGSSNKVSSPEDALSPAGASEGGRSFASGGSFEGRNRSGSVQSHKTLLQVTMDNEQFILVDVTGMTTAEGIRDRVFAKVSLHSRRCS